jgi:hypothetical protein
MPQQGGFNPNDINFGQDIGKVLGDQIIVDKWPENQSPLFLESRTPGGRPISRDYTGLDEQARNDGVFYHPENTSASQRAQDYQSQAPGARDGLAPSIEFVNSNRRGNDFIKFDGVAVENINGVPTTVLIDRKISVTSKTDQKAALDRMSEALGQNPQVQGVIEVPTQAKADRTNTILRDRGIENIRVRVVPEGINP